MSGQEPMTSCSASWGRPGMQIAFLPHESRRCRPLPARAAFAETDSIRFALNDQLMNTLYLASHAPHCLTFSPANLKCELDLACCGCCGGK